MSKDPLRTPEVASACQIIKAACMRVLNTPTTFGYTFNAATKGRLSVVYEKDEKLSPKELQEIEEKANSLIAEDIPIVVTKMAKKDAESKFSTSIYDAIKPPESVTELNICEIAGWNVNAVKGKLNGITINSQNFRPAKKHVELVFTILSKEEVEKKKNATPKAKGKPAPKKANEFFDQLSGQKVEALEPSEQLVNYLFSELSVIDVKTEEGKKKLREVMLAESEILFNHVRNVSYTQGFNARI